MMPKTIKIIYWIITILFGLFMLFSSYSELMRLESANAVLIALGYPVYLNTILGIAKLLGVIAIFQTKFKTIKEWAYAGFTIDIGGAMMSFILLNGDFKSVLLTLPFLVVMFVSYFMWKKVDSIK